MAMAQTGMQLQTANIQHPCSLFGTCLPAVNQPQEGQISTLCPLSLKVKNYGNGPFRYAAASCNLATACHKPACHNLACHKPTCHKPPTNSRSSLSRSLNLPTTATMVGGTQLFEEAHLTGDNTRFCRESGRCSDYVVFTQMCPL